MAAYPTRLESLGCGSCEQAPALLGRRRTSGGVNCVPVVFHPTRGACSTHIVIPKGFVALVNRHGRYVGKWGAGLHWAAPWVNVSHLVPEQFIVYEYDIPMSTHTPLPNNVFHKVLRSKSAQHRTM